LQELDPEEHLQALQHIGSVPLGAIREKLFSRSLQLAVQTVVNSMASHIPAISNLALETTKNSLESVAKKLQFVKFLHTRLLLLPNSVDITRAAKDSIIPEWQDGSQHRTLYFVSRSNACILVAEPPAYISVVDVIAIVVSQILGSPTPLPIGSLFSCPEGCETAIVDILKLCTDKKGPTSGSTSVIGKEILPQDALQVQFHPLRPFYAGEIVAWRPQNGEKLKYGRVPEDVRPHAGQALYRFKVEVSSELTKPLLSSQVFSFRSISTGNEASSATLLDSTHAVIGSRTHVEVPKISGGAKTRSPQVWPSLYPFLLCIKVLLFVCFSFFWRKTYTAIKRKETYPDNSAILSSCTLHDFFILDQELLMHRFLPVIWV